MNQNEAMTTLRGLRDCLADLPNTAPRTFSVRGGSASASGIAIGGSAPAIIQARGGDATVVVSKEAGKEMAAVISELIDVLDGSRDKHQIDQLLDSIKNYAYIGAVVIRCVAAILGVP
jgi:hypothetical protein